MIALTPDFSAMRLTQETEASSSRGLMVSISVTPIPSQYLFNIDFLDNFSHDGPSGARVWLVAGHGSCRVVENNEYHICLIVDCIYYAGDRGGEKCRIAHECKAGGIGFYFFYALCNIESGAHAQTSIDHVKRHGISKCITADVTAENRFLTFHGSLMRRKKPGADSRHTEPEDVQAEPEALEVPVLLTCLIQEMYGYN